MKPSSSLFGLVNNSSSSSIKKGWFTETETMWPGQKFSLALDGFSSTDAVLYDAQSAYQSILVFQSAQYGRVLVLDGVIQFTERDEFAYHETMVHVPVNAHRNPVSVLIVGGGDGGILREVLKYDFVQHVTVVEIDPMVVQVARKFFASSTAPAHVFEDPRVTLVHQDAATFLADRAQEAKEVHQNGENGDIGHVKRQEAGNVSSELLYDIILGDTSDPVGPAESLFQPAFYEAMYECLKPGGIVCVQAECFWIHLDLISDLYSCTADIFGTKPSYISTLVPTYPCGQIGFLLVRKAFDTTTMTMSLRQSVFGIDSLSCRQPVRVPTFANELKWYSPDMHRAAFVLPPFVRQQLKVIGKDNDGDEDEDNDDNQYDFEDEKEYKCFLQKPPACSIL